MPNWAGAGVFRASPPDRRAGPRPCLTGRRPPSLPWSAVAPWGPAWAAWPQQGFQQKEIGQGHHDVRPIGGRFSRAGYGSPLVESHRPAPISSVSWGGPCSAAGGRFLKSALGKWRPATVCFRDCPPTVPHGTAASSNHHSASAHGLHFSSNAPGHHPKCSRPRGARVSGRKPRRETRSPSTTRFRSASSRSSGDG